MAARVGTAAALIPALLAALFFLPKPWFAALGALVAATAGFEWARLCRMQGATAWIYAGAMALAFVALYNTEPRQPTFLLAALFWIVIAPWWMWRGVQGRALIIAGFVVIVPAALAFVILNPLEVLLVLLLVWIADSAAYFVGRAWGRRKLAPAISPGKTWEGAIGGTVGVLVYAIILGTFIEGIFWVPYLLAAALLAVLSIVGDLFESAVKRQAGAKDSGTLLPGHGGILDRIDSATATLPVAALLWPYLRTLA
ncbi:MAG TPA: phosphatidate cytidylyltransferase [Burkholderiales bacterium]|nr:phosphatidate cytidylyltransferase [Burkholderiales bacterium]